MDTYPEITLTPVYHRHVWQRLEYTGDPPHWPAAKCLDCDATMTRGQVEAILNYE